MTASKLDETSLQLAVALKIKTLLTNNSREALNNIMVEVCTFILLSLGT